MNFYPDHTSTGEHKSYTPNLIHRHYVDEANRKHQTPPP